MKDVVSLVDLKQKKKIISHIDSFHGHAYLEPHWFIFILKKRKIERITENKSNNLTYLSHIENMPYLVIES